MNLLEKIKQALSPTRPEPETPCPACGTWMEYREPPRQYPLPKIFVYLCPKCDYRIYSRATEQEWWEELAYAEFMIRPSDDPVAWANRYGGE